MLVRTTKLPVTMDPRLAVSKLRKVPPFATVRVYMSANGRRGCMTYTRTETKSATPVRFRNENMNEEHRDLMTATLEPLRFDYPETCRVLPGQGPGHEGTLFRYSISDGVMGLSGVIAEPCLPDAVYPAGPTTDPCARPGYLLDNTRGAPAVENPDGVMRTYLNGTVATATRACISYEKLANTDRATAVGLWNPAFGWGDSPGNRFVSTERYSARIDIPSVPCGQHHTMEVRDRVNDIDFQWDWPYGYDGCSNEESATWAGGDAPFAGGAE